MIKMNIAYTSSNLYSEIAAVSIISLLENNKDCGLDIYIIDNRIRADNKKRLENVVNAYSQNIFFIPLPNVEGLVGKKINVGRWNISTFGRCFLASTLPDSIDRLIFIDADTIVRHSLKELYELDFHGKAVYGVDDCRGSMYRKNIGLAGNANYINCGFMLLNLSKWRELGIEREFINFINKKNGDITYMDQGVINGILGQKDLIGLLPPKFNCQRLYFDFSYKDFIKLRKPSFSYTKDEYELAIADPVIVHFTTCFITGTRPWNAKDAHPYKEEFLYYKAMTPWGAGSFWPDDRRIMKKFMAIVCKAIPKPLMIFIISIVHTKLYPAVRNIKMSRR